MNEVFKYRQYIYYNVRAKLISEVIKNHLGILWWVLEPILQMLVFYYVFVVLMDRRTENFTDFLLIGMTTWAWFSRSIIAGANSIRRAGNILGQFPLPAIIMPIMEVLVNSFRFILIFTLLTAFVGFRYGLSIHWLAVFVLILTQFIFIIGVTTMVSAITPLIPDINVIIRSAMTALMFCSGVFFEVQKTHKYYDFFILNPMARLIDLYRQVLLHSKWPDWQALVWIGAIGLFLYIIANFLSRTLNNTYIKTVT